VQSLFQTRQRRRLQLAVKFMRKENVLFQNERQITRAEYAQTRGEA
jgi:hypothetical protein